MRVFAPASVSNVGPGFDVLGFALHRPGDTVDAERVDQPGVTLVSVDGEDGRLPVQPQRNAASVAALAVMRRARVGPTAPGLSLRLHKGMPLASGLGSSGASAAAGAVAANQLLGRPLSPIDLVACAMEGEKAACGSAHADNVAPSVLGGFVLVRSYDPLDLVRLPVPDGIFVAVVHPHCRVSTKEARARLAACTFPLSSIVANSGNLGALVAALYQGDAALLGRSVQDRLVEPVRAGMIPGFAAVKAAAREAGALACSISGSGPSMFAFADTADGAARVAQAMRGAFRSAADLTADVWVGPISRDGARVVG